MKWYIAGRTKQRNKIASAVKSLRNKGDKVEFDWTCMKDPRPFDQHLKECRDISKKITQAILNSDIFVLNSDPEGTDMFIEYGIALAQASKSKKPKIYIVGRYNKRSLMHFHPLAKHKDTLEEIIDLEKINKK